jgi:hypothetical protein
MDYVAISTRRFGRQYEPAAHLSDDAWYAPEHAAIRSLLADWHRTMWRCGAARPDHRRYKTLALREMRATTRAGTLGRAAVLDWAASHPAPHGMHATLTA